MQDLASGLACVCVCVCALFMIPYDFVSPHKEKKERESGTNGDPEIQHICLKMFITF